MTSTEMTGAEMVIKALLDQEADVVFGYPGGAVLPIYDALFKQNKLRHILVRHEPGAIHAAEGYARSTGKVGVVLVTSGPGATNAITGIATAYMDSIPMVVISGQVQSHLIGEDASASFLPRHRCCYWQERSCRCRYHRPRPRPCHRSRALSYCR